MSYRDCLNRIKAAAKGRLSDKEAEELLEAIADHADRQRGKAGVEAAVRQFAQDAFERKRVEAAMARKHAVLNATAFRANDTRLQRMIEAGLKPVQAFQALIHGLNKRVAGVRQSAQATIQAYESRYVGGVMARIAKERPHLERTLFQTDLFGRPTPETVAFNERIVKEMEKPGSTKDADAAFVAKVFSEAAEVARRDLNRLGAFIGKMEGWFPHSHDPDRLLKVKEDDWIAFIEPLLDLDRTFKGVPDAERRRILADIYRTVVTGQDDAVTARAKGEFRAPGNLAKRLGEQRFLHFKNSDAWIAYNRRFGMGPATAAMFGHLRQAANYAGMMEVFGPNPEAMIGRLAEATQQRIRSAPVGAAERAQIDSLGRVEEWGAWRVLTGKASVPADRKLARIGAGIRAWESASKLMGAVLSSLPTDPAMLALNLRFQGKPFLEAWAQTLRGYLRGRGQGEARHVAFLLGEGYDGLIRNALDRYSALDTVPGRLSRMAGLAMKVQGLTGYTDVGKAVGARIMAADMGHHAGSGWDALPIRYRNVLELQGIGAARWDVLRQAAYEGENGTRYVTPESIRTLPDEALDPLLPPVKRKRSPEALAAARDKARVELELDFRRFIADEAGFGIVEPDVRTRAVATGGGLQAGTIGGEAARLAMQFKGFPVAFTQRVLGRRLASSPDYGSRAANAMHGSLHMGEFMAVLFVAGLLAMWAKDVSRGRSPKALVSDDGEANYKTIVAALTQGGGLGIYGDFLFGEYNRFGRGAFATLLGPAVGEAETLLGLLESLREGEPKASRFLSFALGNTPFINFWATRAALDYLFISSLREAVSPGYIARQERRMREEYGQEPMLEPLRPFG